MNETTIQNTVIKCSVINLTCKSHWKCAIFYWTEHSLSYVLWKKNLSKLKVDHNKRQQEACFVHVKGNQRRDIGNTLSGVSNHFFLINECFMILQFKLPFIIMIL